MEKTQLNNARSSTGYEYKVSLFSRDDLLFYLSINKYLLETGELDKPYIRIYATKNHTNQSVGYAFFRTQYGASTYIRLLRFIADEYETSKNDMYTLTTKTANGIKEIDRGLTRPRASIWNQ